MPFKDFTTFIEDDINNRLSQTAAKSTFTGLRNDEDGFLSSDEGANHFNGDFEHLLTVQVDAFSGAALHEVYALTNVIDSRFDIMSSSGDMLGIGVWRDGGGTQYIFISEVFGGTAYFDTWASLVTSTPYYLTFKRDEAVGTFGTLYCFIYSDSGRTTLIDTLVLTLHGKIDFRYIISPQSYTSGSTQNITGFIENLDIQEATVGNLINGGLVNNSLIGGSRLCG